MPRHLLGFQLFTDYCMLFLAAEDEVIILVFILT